MKQIHPENYNTFKPEDIVLKDPTDPLKNVSS